MYELKHTYSEASDRKADGVASDRKAADGVECQQSEAIGDNQRKNLWSEAWKGA